MFLLPLLALTGVAPAAELSPDYTPGATHSWVVEVHRQVQQMGKTVNHKAAMEEAWSGRLDCTVQDKPKRTEKCTFHDGRMWFGWTPPGAGAERKLHEIKAPVEILVSYNPVGRVTRWRVEGDQEAFYESLTMAYHDQIKEGQWPVTRVDFQRRLGRELEQSLMIWFLAPFDIELPRSGTDPGQSWKFKELPYAARWSQGAIGNGTIETWVATKVDQGYVVDLAGKASQQVQASPNAELPVVQTDQQVLNNNLTGRTLIDPADGRILMSEIWSLGWSTLPMLGFKNTRFKATAWSEGLSDKPGPMPKPPATPKGN